MKIISLWAVFLTLSIISTAYGFNGERKGFVLGGGLGLAPLIKTSTRTDVDNNSGVGLNLLIGHAWDEQNMIVY